MILADDKGQFAQVFPAGGNLVLQSSRADAFATAENRNAVHKAVTVWMEQANREHALAELANAEAAPQPEVQKP